MTNVTSVQDSLSMLDLALENLNLATKGINTTDGRVVNFDTKTKNQNVFEVSNSVDKESNRNGSVSQVICSRADLESSRILGEFEDIFLL